MLQFLQIPIWIKHPVLSKLTNHCTDEELCVDDNHLHKDQLPLAWMVVLQSIHVLGCVPASRQAVGRRLSTLGRCRRASRQPLSEVLVKRNRAVKMMCILNGAHRPRLPSLCRRSRLRGGRRAEPLQLHRVEIAPRTPPGTSPKPSPDSRPLVPAASRASTSK